MALQTFQRGGELCNSAAGQRIHEVCRVLIVAFFRAKMLWKNLSAYAFSKLELDNHFVDVKAEAGGQFV